MNIVNKVEYRWQKVSYELAQIFGCKELVPICMEYYSTKEFLYEEYYLPCCWQSRLDAMLIPTLENVNCKLYALLGQHVGSYPPAAEYARRIATLCIDPEEYRIYKNIPSFGAFLCAIHHVYDHCNRFRCFWPSRECICGEPLR